MFQKLGFLIFLFSCVSHADIVEKIQNMNERIKAVGKPAEDCTSCALTTAGKSDLTDLTKACVEEICPDPRLSISAILQKAYQRAANPGAVYKKEIFPLIHQTAVEQTQDDLEKMKRLRDWIAEAPPLKDVGAVRILNFTKFLNGFPSRQDVLRRNSDGGVEIDSEKSRPAFSSLTDVEFRQRVTLGNFILNLKQKKLFKTTDPAKLRMYYPGDSLMKYIDQVIAEIGLGAQAMMANPELSFLSETEAFRRNLSVVALKGRFAGDQITSDALEDLSTAKNVVEIFKALGADPDIKALLTSPSLDIKKLTRDQGAAKHIEDQIKAGETYLKAKDIGDSPTCRVAFALGQEILPSEAELTQYKEKAQQIKARYLAGLSKYVSEESKQKIEIEMAKWFVSLPMSREQHLVNLKQNLHKRLSEMRRHRVEDKKETAARRVIKDSMLVAGFKDDAEKTKRSYHVKKTVGDYCDQLIPSYLPDSALSVTGGFVVGPISMKMGRHADGIIYHELTHLLYGFFERQVMSAKTKQWFDKSRACLTVNHQDLSFKERNSELMTLRYGMSPFYTNEDWADLISAEMDDQDANMGCLLARQSKRSDYKNMSFRNLDRTDPHSSEFYRLLHLQFLKKGSVPASCKTVVKLQGTEINFKDCRKPH